jgi:hypothetical protein
MKVYTFQALGIPVICPSLLWPPHLSKVHALLLGPGVSQDLGFASDWLAEQRPTLEWRKNFVNKNSWDARARDVVGIL